MSFDWSPWQGRSRIATPPPEKAPVTIPATEAEAQAIRAAAYRSALVRIVRLNPASPYAKIATAVLTEQGEPETG